MKRRQKVSRDSQLRIQLAVHPSRRYDARPCVRSTEASSTFLNVVFRYARNFGAVKSVSPWHKFFINMLPCLYTLLLAILLYILWNDERLAGESCLLGCS